MNALLRHMMMSLMLVGALLSGASAQAQGRSDHRRTMGGGGHSTTSVSRPSSSDRSSRSVATPSRSMDHSSRSVATPSRSSDRSTRSVTTAPTRSADRQVSTSTRNERLSRDAMRPQNTGRTTVDTRRGGNMGGMGRTPSGNVGSGRDNGRGNDNMGTGRGHDRGNDNVGTGRGHDRGNDNVGTGRGHDRGNDNVGTGHDRGNDNVGTGRGHDRGNDNVGTGRGHDRGNDRSGFDRGGTHSGRTPNGRVGGDNRGHYPGDMNRDHNRHGDHRPGIHGTGNRPPMPKDRGYHAYRDHYRWNYRHNNWSRPLPPPMRAYRPRPLRWYRPPVPVHYRPYYGAPVIDRILGITFGTLFEASLNHLYYSGYTIDGYEGNIIYLRDVSMLNLLWPDVMLSYDAGRLVNAQFVYSTAYRDMIRYNATYDNLCRVYGSPISIHDSAYDTAVTWYGGNSVGYVTLTLGNASGRWYTTLSVGQ